MSLVLKKALSTAETATAAAAAWLEKNQGVVTVTKFKEALDIQTSADLQAEKIIFSEINKIFPDHNLFSEEAGLIDKKSDYTWIIDPLDGTKEYVKDQKNWLSLVAVQNRQEVLVGCVYNPNLKITYKGHQKGKAYKNDQILKVSAKKTLSESIVALKFPNHPASPIDHLQVLQAIDPLLKQCYRLRSSHYDAWNICLVAEGVHEAFILLGNYGPKWWDVAPALIIAKQAGAKITTTKGRPIRLNDLEKGLVVSNELIHDQLLAIINQ
jgi:myo-inositol-1(or 4)-monophosphatase